MLFKKKFIFCNDKMVYTIGVIVYYFYKNNLNVLKCDNFVNIDNFVAKKTNS